ncbi:MAG: cyclic nucleotide-binding domain-containing protein [SAR324 cluster bacterium]|nr:cyclic nucleotide-binding domain-containing protein [SAR324 cluster bacterium]
MSKIEKIQVTEGVFWVGIPEAELSILCGCPADSVKHLKKRGLIVNKEEDGIVFESGPNTILLSDVLVQNGSFSNLAEFPVLQMFYQQGFLFPNHPNSGKKPLLIGAKDQLKSQLQYIYRGNYGLISEEEIIDAGISEEQAHQMMRLKLRFALGGKIQTYDELLDSLELEDQVKEIRNGVEIRRMDINIFEFKYQGETVSVDLNLDSSENYGAAYQLGFHEAKRDYFSVVHSGEGDGWDTNRPCMASILMFQGKIYLLDVGPNVIFSLMSLGIGVNEIEGIFHTHAHDDHFAGLPTLMRTDRRIKYFSTPLVRASVVKKLSALVSIKESDFSHFFEVHDLEFDTWNDIEGLEVFPIFSPHPVETCCFLFRTLWKGGYRSYGHYADIVSLKVLESFVTDDETKPGITQAYFEEVKEKYLIPADLKKIDIGGGLIHGMAEDFRDDQSGKIILSHTSKSLSSHEKEIGSEAAFGMTDVLISSKQIYVMQYAFKYLHSYFPSVPSHQLRILLNNNLISFNAGSILLKKGTTNDDIYLIVGGIVEAIQAKDGFQHLLSAGSLISETSEFTGKPSTTTYRAASFVQALQLPSSLYFEFAKRNNVYEELAKLQKNRTFLGNTWLLGDGISDPVQNLLAQRAKLIPYTTGHAFPQKDSSIFYLIRSGSLKSYIDDEAFESLSEGDFFGEEDILFDIPCLFTVRVEEDAELYQIPGEVLLDIPIARWKMLETFQKRMRRLGKHLMLNR